MKSKNKRYIVMLFFEDESHPFHEFIVRTDKQFKDEAELEEFIKNEIEDQNIQADHHYTHFYRDITDEPVYVNVYEVTRHYGGPEEGGWWYNHHEIVEVYPVREKIAHRIKDWLEKKHSWRKEGNIYSVLGGTDLEVSIDDTPGQSYPIERPHYE